MDYKQTAAEWWDKPKWKGNPEGARFKNVEDLARLLQQVDQAATERAAKIVLGLREEILDAVKRAIANWQSNADVGVFKDGLDKLVDYLNYGWIDDRFKDDLYVILADAIRNQKG